MRILQFTCDDDVVSNSIKTFIISQLNIWSRLDWLTTDIEYITNKFDMDFWKNHTTIANIHWINWDDVYSNLGSDGKLIADSMIGDVVKKGFFELSPIDSNCPDLLLEIVKVDDLVESAYELAIVTPEE